MLSCWQASLTLPQPAPARCCPAATSRPAVTASQAATSNMVPHYIAWCDRAGGRSGRY